VQPQQWNSDVHLVEQAGTNQNNVFKSTHKKVKRAKLADDEQCDLAVTNEMTDPLLRMACQHLTFPMDENAPFSVTDTPTNTAMLTERLCTHPKIFFCAQVGKPFFATSKHGMVWHCL